MFDVQRTRPRNFTDYIGNKDNVTLLRMALKEDFPPFTILIGPTGVGKTTISKLLAKTLTCQSAYNGVPCGACSHCLDVDNLVIGKDKNSSNIMIFRMSDEGGKRSARKVEEQIKTRPLSGMKKVIILEECQGMSSEAQELLLPVLEHLPDYIHVIACTTNSRSLLDTFKGRSTPFYFKKPSTQEVLSLLERTTAEQGYKVNSPLVFSYIVEVAGRTPRDCLQLFQKISSFGSEIKLQDALVFLNVVDENLYLEYLELLRGDMGLVLDFVDKVDNSHSSLTEFMRGLDAFMVKLMSLRYRSAMFSEDIGKRAKEFLKKVGEVRFLEMQSTISDNADLIINHVNPKSAIVSLSFKLKGKTDFKLGTTSEATHAVEMNKSKLINETLQKANTLHNTAPTQLSDNALLRGTSSKIIRRSNQPPTEQ